MGIPETLRSFVVERARERCEYCQLSQVGQEAQFHIDHIEPVSAGGATDAENLALACVSCSLRKGARRFVRVPNMDRTVAVFNPRRQHWAEHFRWEGAWLKGATDTGHALVEALHMNRPVIVAIRQEEIYRGRHPA